LKLELGDLKHSILNGAACAVPHNSSMIRLERDLAERMFRRPDGATVIVATPTLAQGLNLPAQLAVFAGDKWAAKEGGREDLEAHEILNAAARAGRAEHLANGVVLLVPEPIIGFARGKSLADEVVEKLRAGPAGGRSLCGNFRSAGGRSRPAYEGSGARPGCPLYNQSHGAAVRVR
jgi:superfamily II helicase